MFYSTPTELLLRLTGAAVLLSLSVFLLCVLLVVLCDVTVFTRVFL